MHRPVEESGTSDAVIAGVVIPVAQLVDSLAACLCVGLCEPRGAAVEVRFYAVRVKVAGLLGEEADLGVCRRRRWLGG